MAKNFFVGPATLYIGDPTQAAGAGMVSLGDIESVTFNPGVQMTGVTTAQTGDSYDADGIYAMPPNPMVEAQLYESDLEKLTALILGGTEQGTAGLGFGGQTAKIDSPPTLLVIPDFEADDGEEAEHAIWLPAVTIEVTNLAQFGRMQAGGNSANAYSVSFKAARRVKDQADADIPDGCQYAYMGPLTDLGLAWTPLTA